MHEVTNDAATIHKSRLSSVTWIEHAARRRVSHHLNVYQFDCVMYVETLDRCTPDYDEADICTFGHGQFIPRYMGK